MKKLFRHKPTNEDFSPDISPELYKQLKQLADAEGKKPDELLREILPIYSEQKQREKNKRFVWESLPEREREICAMICAEYTNKQIAEELKISINTVRSYSSSIYGKFAVKSRKELKLLLADWDFSAFF